MPFAIKNGSNDIQKYFYKAAENICYSVALRQNRRIIMFKKVKKILTGIIASAMIVSCAGCGTGKSTAYALTVDGYQVKAGIYIYYQYSAFQEAKNLAAKANEKLDVNDEKALKKAKIDGKDFLQWVEDKATISCAEHVAAIKKFDEMKLTLDEDDIEAIETNAESYYDENPEMFEDNGIGEESLKDIMANTYKVQKIFESLYGEDGTEGVKNEDIKNFYIENNARVKYIGLDLHDSQGNDLDETGKKEIKDMADDFLKRAKNADSTEKMLDEFDVMQEEYDKYVADKAAEAAGEETTEAVTEAATEATTEATTTEITTASTVSDNNETDVTTAKEVSSSETTTTSVSESTNEAETTTKPYANETIIPVVTTNENTKEEEVKYTPSKTFYDWVYDKAKTGSPEIVEDEDTLYVAVRLDITERMTDDDLWSEQSIDNTRFDMFSDDLQDKLDEWVSGYSIDKNKKAYKRYDPFDFKMPSE